MKQDLTTGTWQDDTGCPISIILVSTFDGSSCAVGAENETAIFGSEIDTTRTEHVRCHQIGHHRIA